MNEFIRRLLPFIYIGILIVVLIFGIILVLHLLVLGALVGIGLFAIAWIKAKFFPPKNLTPHIKHRPGRTIDHDEKP